MHSKVEVNSLTLKQIINKTKIAKADSFLMSRPLYDYQNIKKCNKIYKI